MKNERQQYYAIHRKWHLYFGVRLQSGTVRTVVRGREHRPLKGAATAQGQQL